MNRRIFALSMLLIFMCSLFCPFATFGADSADNEERHLNIVTSDNRPLSIDRLLYTAFKDIDYQASFATFALRTGYEMANNGEKDGVIASTPDMEQTYPNLIKVPVQLEQTNIFAFVRADSGLDINSWSGLSGLKVAILTQRLYVLSQIPKDATVATEETSKIILNKLAAGEYDAAVLVQRAHEEISLPSNVMNAGKLEVLSEYLYMHKNHKNLIPDIAVSLNSIFEDGRGEKILSDIPVYVENHKKTVLRIISANADLPREEQFESSFMKQFENDMSVDWYKLELNSKRFSRDPSSLTYFANFLRQDCLSKDVAAIIVSGEDAMSFLVEYYNLYFRNVPVLFYGVCDEYKGVIEGYEPYFTGIVGEFPAYETVEDALKLFPDTKHLYVLNDYTTEGSHYRAIIEDQLKPITQKVDIEYSNNSDLDSLLERIRELPQNGMVFVGSYFCDADGQYYPRNEMKRLMERECGVPIFSMHSATELEYNAIGGKCLDYEKYGETIAGMLKHLLNGGDIGDIPVVSGTSEYNRWVFDKNAMDKWDINEKSLPAGSQVLNKIPSIWESDPRFAWTLVVLVITIVSVVISISVFQVRYRRQKELIIKDEKIREVKERLERIINTAPLAFTLTVDGIVVEANEYMRNHFGIMMGDAVRPIYAEPTQRDRLIEKAAVEHGVENRILSYNMPNGSKQRFLSYITTVEYEKQEAYMLWAMNIEENERQKDQLHIAQMDLQTILDTMPVPVRITDNESATIVYANNICLEMFGCKSLGDMVGRPLTEMMPAIQSDGTNSREKLQLLLNSEVPITVEVEYLVSECKIIEASITACNIVYAGKKSTIAIIIDVSAEKERQKMLLSAAEKEKEANNLKSRFLVNMSHEIRTPMNAIIGLTEIGLRKKPSREIMDVYKKINISAKHLLEIINDILDLSKIEADKVELFNDEFELEDVLNSALLVATPRLDGKNVEFMLNAELDLPRYIIGDRTRLWQILKNFLDNAAKYTEDGKIVLSAFVNRNRSDAENVCITFIIEDTGIGITDEQMQKIFMPYRQFYNEAQKRYTGTGLGMVISKQLCELMGGEMRIESNMGMGTSIYVTIPFKRSENNETALQTIKTTALAGINVLAVDDDEVSLGIMEELLGGSGAKCKLARSGEETLKTIFDSRDRGESFDLILLDYMMEGLNGLETAKQIQTGLSKAPKLLMVTAYQRLLLKEELEKSGIDDVIEKPFIPTQFIHKLCVAMGHSDGFNEKPQETFTMFKDVHVLLCEDYHLNQEVAVGMFAQFGIAATVAENGKQGVEILNTGKTFDLIFMDLQMPVMDGYEATRIIRSDPRFDNIPIISLTADAMKEVVDECRKAGMDDHVTKPIEFSSLNKIFMKWLPEDKRASGDTVVVTESENEALARFGGKKDLYEWALREFAEILPDEWPDFNYAAYHLDETKRSVHKIKGAAGNLSEKDIFQYATQFESSLRDNAPDKGLYEALISAGDAFKKRISEQMESENGASAVGTREELKENLNQLEEALLSYDLKKSSKAVDALKGKIWPDADESKLEQLYGLMQNYDYVSALDILESMREI